MPDDSRESDSGTGANHRNGKLAIPLPFEKALKAATNIPADRLAPARNGKLKQSKRGKKSAERP